MRKVWPAAGVDLTRVTSAIEIGKEAGILIETATLRGGCYGLSPTVPPELADSFDWAKDAVDSFAADLYKKAREDFPGITIKEARIWSDLVARALLTGIANRLEVFRGDVGRGSEPLFPKSFDTGAMFSSLEQQVAKPEVLEFLKAETLEAIDPTTEFGNVLIGQIATGCLLHSFLARRDNVAARAITGSLQGICSILDTPILMRLLAPGATGQAMMDTIAAAIKAGFDVVLPNHVTEEFLGHFDWAEEELLPPIDAQIAKGLATELIAQLEADDFVRYYLQGLSRGTHRSFKEFRAGAESLLASLISLGVRCTGHGNEGDIKGVSECEEELTRAIALRTKLKRSRGVTQIARDAHTMTMAMRLRDSAKGVPSQLWPRAWVITTDRSMPVAYRAIRDGDKWPLTIAPSQWVEMISTFAPPAELEALARSAADLLAYDTFISIASRFPPKVALEVADALGTEGSFSNVDVRVAQLSLEGFDLPGNGAETSGAIVSKVLARKARRLQEGYKEGLSRSRGDNQETQSKLDAAERREREKDNTILELKAVRPEAEAEERTKQPFGARRTVVVVTFVLMLGVLAYALGRGWWWVAMGTAIAACYFYRASRDWARNKELSVWWLLATLLPELTAVALQVFKPF